MGTLVVLVIILVAVLGSARRHLRVAADPDAIVVAIYLGFWIVWMLVSAAIAVVGGYVETTDWFAMDGATLVPLCATVLFVLHPRARPALQRWAESISVREYVWIHAIRVAAIGTIAKMLGDELPRHFILPVGIPDFAFGLSVPLVAWMAGRGALGRRGLVAWNALGALLFFPTLVLLYLSVPSPIQSSFAGPNTLEVFEFPMALVPTVIAPLFIVIHCAAIVRLRGAGMRSLAIRPRRGR